jgi:maleylacetoacetate isomerase
MKLFGYFRSSASYRVRIALNLKGLACEQVAINLKAGEQLSEQYQALNPQRLVPALSHDGHLITQSLAIMAYLDETFPDRQLVVGTAANRAKIRAIAATVACDTQPLQNLRVLKYLSGELQVSDEQRLQWTQHWISDGLNAVEKMVEHEGFCVGSIPTLADVCLIPQIYNARRFNIDMSAYPKLSAIEARCEALDAFADAHPSVQPDFVAD